MAACAACAACPRDATGRRRQTRTTPGERYLNSSPILYLNVAARNEIRTLRNQICGGVSDNYTVSGMLSAVSPAGRYVATSRTPRHPAHPAHPAAPRGVRAGALQILARGVCPRRCLSCTSTHGVATPHRHTHPPLTSNAPLYY